MSSKCCDARAELWRYRPDRPVGGSGVASVDVVIVELKDTDENCGYGFTYVLKGSGEPVCVAARKLLDAHLKDQELRPPPMLWRRMSSSLGRIGKGESWLAIAAIDLAAWDLHAKQRAVTLGVALGGEHRPVRLYGSGGFLPGQSSEDAIACAREYARRGLAGVKLRASASAQDRELIRDVAAALPKDMRLMVDANEKCDLPTAISLARTCAEYGVFFLEEPLPAEELEAYKTLAGHTDTAIALGEHLGSSRQVFNFLHASVCAVLQPDLAMMGGVTGCLRAIRLAEEFGLSVTPHFLPDLFIHVAAAAPNVTLLEDFPLLEPLFERTAKTDDQGHMVPSSNPGHGLMWSKDARKLFQVSF